MEIYRRKSKLSLETTIYLYFVSVLKLIRRPMSSGHCASIFAEYHSDRRKLTVDTISDSFVRRKLYLNARLRKITNSSSNRRYSRPDWDVPAPLLEYVTWLITIIDTWTFVYRIVPFEPIRCTVVFHRLSFHRIT